MNPQSSPETAPPPSAQAFAPPGLRRMAWGLLLFSGLLLLLVAVVAWRTWRQSEREAIARLQAQTVFFAGGLHEHYAQAGLLARIMAREIRSRPEMLSHPAQAQRWLQANLPLFPQAITLNLAAPDRQLIASATLPLAARPNLALYHAIQPGMDEAAKQSGLEIGWPVVGPVVRQLVTPLRYSVRDAQGHLLAIIGIPISSRVLLSRLKAISNVLTAAYPDIAVGMIRTDGHLLARWPEPHTGNLAAFYARRRQGVLFRDMEQHPGARSGVVTGHMDADPQSRPFARLVVWRRVPGYPVVAYVAIPLRNLAALWWRHMWPIFTGLILLFLLIWLGYRRIAAMARDLQRNHVYEQVLSSAGQLALQTDQPQSLLQKVAQLLTQHSLAREVQVIWEQPAERTTPGAKAGMAMEQLLQRALRTRRLVQADAAAAVALPLSRESENCCVLLLQGLTGYADLARDGFLMLKRLQTLLNEALDYLDLRRTLRDERDQQHWLARHDHLTGLPNRNELATYLNEAKARADRHEKLLAVAMLDLDDFKPVNDMHGHAAGDALLKELGQRLLDGARKTDFVARLGGDEFIFVFEDIPHMEDLEAALARVEKAVAVPFLLPDGTAIQVGGSVGITLYPFDEVDSDGLLRHADQALYAAKARKGARERFWQYFNPGEASTALRLRGRLAEDAVAYFQPVLSLRERKLIGVEALARLRDGKRILAPAEFLPLLGINERRDLSRLMLTQGLALLERLDAAGIHLELSINVDPDVLLDHDCASCLAGAISASAVEPQRVTLEILENGDFLSLPDARERLLSLKATGARVALDDVGSAYSSLLRLKELPVDKIKLDQGFVSDLHEKPANLVFVQSVLALAQGLGAQLVVEGVETETILDALAALDVEAVQGYAIAQPAPAETFVAWARAWTLPESLRLRQAHTLLGAYAAHLHHKSLLEGLHSAELVSAAACNCGLEHFLAQRGQADHPIVQIHRRIAEFLKLPPESRPRAELITVERELAALVEKALRPDAEVSNIAASVSPQECAGWGMSPVTG